MHYNAVYINSSHTTKYELPLLPSGFWHLALPIKSLQLDCNKNKNFTLQSIMNKGYKHINLIICFVNVSIFICFSLRFEELELS